MLKTDKLESKLKEVVGETNIVTDPDKREAYRLEGKSPTAVVSPATIDEVSKLVAFAHENELAVIPRGNGTKMGTGGIPKKSDIVLLTMRLQRIPDMDCENLTLTAECGIPLAVIQDKLAKEGKGYFLPLDPPFSERATLGGIVATNSSGPKRLLYGSARDLVIGLKAVFPNGDIVVSGGKTVKNVSGYDLSKLLIGSFGSLGIICEATFKLLPLPERRATLLAFFERLENAHEFVREIMSSQLTPASIETLNAMVVNRLNRCIPFSLGGNYLVAIGLEGVVEGVERQLSETGERAKKRGSSRVDRLDAKEELPFWIGLRDFSDGGDPNLISLKSNFLISKQGEMIGSYEKMARELDVDCALICHSGNGILHSYLFPDQIGRLKTETLAEFIRRLTGEAVRNGGNLIVESAPLSLKQKIDVWGEVRNDSRIMRRIKEEVDPKGILNPGRFVGGI